MKYKAVIFDLDGTLINSLEDLADSMNNALARSGLPTHPVDDYKSMIGNGVSTLARRAVPNDMPHLVDQVLALMRKNYAQNALNKTYVYPGVTQIVQKLKLNGCKLAVLTNKDQVFAGHIVEHFFGIGVFDRIWGASPGRAIKPDPRALTELLSELDIRVDDAVYVGDSAVDMQVAKAVSMNSIGVLWGFRSEAELRNNGATKIAASANELLDELA